MPKSIEEVHITPSHSAEEEFSTSFRQGVIQKVLHPYESLRRFWFKPYSGSERNVFVWF